MKTGKHDTNGWFWIEDPLECTVCQGGMRMVLAGSPGWQWLPVRCLGGPLLDERLVGECNPECSAGPPGREAVRGCLLCHFLNLGDKTGRSQIYQKNRAHLAWWGFRRFAVLRYSRFLWSVHTRNCCSDSSSQCLHSSRANLTTRSSLSPMQ